jgi:hypothetical protein
MIYFDVILSLQHTASSTAVLSSMARGFQVLYHKYRLTNIESLEEEKFCGTQKKGNCYIFFGK